MADKAPVVPEIKKKKHRSPAYPAISLSQAIKRAEEFYKIEVKNPASFNTVAAHWGFKPTSSGALLAAAALKSFGLVNELESASGRTLQLSPLGLRIVADKRPQSAEREAAIKEAALKPKIHAMIWRRWNGTLPSDTELTYRLENEWNFNVNSISGFIKELRDTISFAKLSTSDSVSQGEEDSHEDNDHPKIKVGDYIQWESQGMFQFRDPMRVSGFSDDGQFLFVDGEKTGVPVVEASIVDAPVSLPKPHIVTPPPLRVVTRNSGGSATMRQDVFSITEGDVVLAWPTPLSAESIQEIKDWLKIAERKIVRSEKSNAEPEVPEK